jgi:hypothetical protein
VRVDRYQFTQLVFVSVGQDWAIMFTSDRMEPFLRSRRLERAVMSTCLFTCSLFNGVVISLYSVASNNRMINEK